jgi:Ca2+-binding EF-hand superfamily protein
MLLIVCLLFVEISDSALLKSMFLTLYPRTVEQVKCSNISKTYQAWYHCFQKTCEKRGNALLVKDFESYFQSYSPYVLTQPCPTRLYNKQVEKLIITCIK